MPRTAKNAKKGGALLNMEQQGNMINNTSDLIKNTEAWKSVINNDLVRAFKYLPTPFSAGTTDGNNYLSGINKTNADAIMPQIGGKKKEAAKPKNNKPKAKPKAKKTAK